MELKKFNRTNNIISIVVLFIASFTYLSTIEPTASFWDCGEFIASSYKLEVGHPPGNPVFQVIARFFTLFGDKDNAAMLVNSMSAMCSAFTIFFLYLTIVHLGRRIVEKSKEELNLANVIAVYGAGIVGALAYCFSDTFWFSAVEGEVYAMSSLFTAVVFWAMLRWEEEADLPYSNRWIALIAFLMGISIGVHLLNLLAIPALVFIYYYKKYEVTKKRTFIVLVLSGVILGAILYGIIPYLPKLAAYVDLLFVNVMGLPMNTGATLFVLGLISAGFWGIYYTYKKSKVLLNAIFLCTTLIVIGYSTFAVVVIRSSANTPTNEYQPDNPFTLVRYIGREQYGSNPLIYGETYASPLAGVETPKYYNTLNGKYVKLDAPFSPVYNSNAKMLFPRMWSSGADDSYIPFYEMYTQGRGTTIPGAKHKMPTFKDNLSYFFGYQVDFMYLRYFMWNFVGRQNDLQANIPGELFKGNWESGIGFIDKARLGDQSEGPDYIVNSRAKNHYFFLPLILGLIGLFYQLKKDRKNWFVTMLLFLLTGIAIVVYLNQPPMQPRERDYAYAGSFYAFTIWIGLAVMWLANLFKKFSKPEIASSIASVLCVAIPFQMASENWNDHDRSGRYTSRDMAYNYLQTLDPNAILISYGDNDTFPLWYIQEVEGVRTDVRVMNTSLLGTDWYIDQMQNRTYESDPVKFTIPRTQYFYGTNDNVPVFERFEGKPVPAKEVIEIFKNPKITIPLSDGLSHNYISARNLIIPVNKENVRKYGIVAEKDMEKVPDTIILNIPQGHEFLGKAELMILDYISHYEWDRPLYLFKNGDVNIGLKDYLQFDGFAYKFVPIKSTTGTSTIQQVDADALYNRIMNVYKWDSFADTTINIDYQNLLTFNNLLSPRDVLTNTAKYLISTGDTLKAVTVLDKMQQIMPAKNFPLNNSVLSALTERALMDAIAVYLQAGEKDKAYKLADAFVAETQKALLLFSKDFNGSMLSADDVQRNLYYILMVSEVFEKNGDSQRAKLYSNMIEPYFKHSNE
ncbi:MAG: DUF2723 domain-containing protein [Bacteroidales bacterium]